MLTKRELKYIAVSLTFFLGITGLCFYLYHRRIEAEKALDFSRYPDPPFIYRTLRTGMPLYWIRYGRPPRSAAEVIEEARKQDRKDRDFFWNYPLEHGYGLATARNGRFAIWYAGENQMTAMTSERLSGILEGSYWQFDELARVVDSDDYIEVRAWLGFSTRSYVLATYRAGVLDIISPQDRLVVLEAMKRYRLGEAAARFRRDRGRLPQDIGEIEAYERGIYPFALEEGGDNAVLPAFEYAANPDDDRMFAIWDAGADGQTALTREAVVNAMAGPYLQMRLIERDMGLDDTLRVYWVAPKEGPEIPAAVSIYRQPPPSEEHFQWALMPERVFREMRKQPLEAQPAPSGS